MGNISTGFSGGAVRRKRLFGWGLVLSVVLLLALYQIGQKKFAEQEKALRSEVRRELVARFADDAASAAAQFGLHSYQPVKVPPPGDGQQSVVVLVHGLDDPGRVWMNLAPTLASQGYAVFQLTYPNDQPIHDSAVFFAAQLSAAQIQSADRIVIVAHSMGGLVSRDMLTHPEIDYPADADAGRVPRVRGLIMVGTPNQGAEVARLRVLGEFREQLSRILLGQGHWLGWLVDGAGEAKIDLLPGSRFLSDLNRRPHPAQVGMLTIAGIAAPVEGLDRSAVVAPILEHVPLEGRGELTKFLQRAAQNVGDGLVPVDAVRLEGVPLLTVSGNHLTMIRNISAEMERVPPAIPLILDQLREWEQTP